MKRTLSLNKQHKDIYFFVFAIQTQQGFAAKWKSFVLDFYIPVFQPLISKDSQQSLVTRWIVISFCK